MRRRGLAAALVLVTALLAAPRWVAATPVPPPARWAVLVEDDSYGGRYPDLPVGYINSGRILSALVERGWPPDHILLLRDSLDRGMLRRATGWLAARVRPGDTALLYIAGEYQFFLGDLSWDTVFPDLWKAIMTPRRVLIVETCFAERLTAAAAGVPGLGLPAVGRDELDWWGLRDTGLVIRGGSFTYFLARALESQPAVTPPDFAAAFATAVAGAREYFHTVIATTPRALDSFHARGSYPERLVAFPNPRLVQNAADAPGDP
jgi:hypothetical protein